MADEVNIEPEFEDDDSFRQRLQRQLNNADQPGSISSGEPVIENDIPGSPSGGIFPAREPKRDKEQDKLLREQEARERKRHREAQQERLAELRRQQTEARREAQQQQREALAHSRDTVRDIRAEAISGRVQAYSLASALGLPGYVMGSMADSMFLRPHEETEAQKQIEYQRRLNNYYDQLAKDREQDAARQSEAVRNMPMQATVLDENGRPLPPSPPGWNTPGGGGSGGRLPPTGLNPPPIHPGGPPAPSSNILGGALPSNVIAGAIEAAHFINSKVDQAGRATSQFGQDVVNDNYTGASKGMVSAAQSAIDPLGVNIPINVAVQGFNALLDINQAILDNSKDSIGSATIEASVAADVSKLMQQISISQRTDATTAEIVKANRQLEEAWMEVKAKLINEYGPVIITLLRGLAEVVGPIGAAISNPVAVGAVLGPWANLVLTTLKGIQSNTDKQEQDQLTNDMLQQLDRFFDPKTKVSVK